MTDLQFQLVVQLAATTHEQFEECLAFTDSVEAALTGEEDTFVDGHDIGLGYYNMFIHTNRPKEIFEKVNELIDATRPDLAFAAGYRSFEEDDYTSLYPRDAVKFELL